MLLMNPGLRCLTGALLNCTRPEQLRCAQPSLRSILNIARYALGSVAMSNSGSPVFISYSRADKDFVTRLVADFQARNISVWIDQAGLKVGTRNWEQLLRETLRSARAVVLVA